jgi:hypothetical protein
MSAIPTESGKPLCNLGYITRMRGGEFNVEVMMLADAVMTPFDYLQHL